MREYFNTCRRHVSQTNGFNCPDVQLYTRTHGLLQKKKKIIRIDFKTFPH